MSAEDICPICRSSRYMNPDMQLLVNPECYHKMCASCVDRIFSVGPAPCPYEKCGRILRKQKFKIQLFEDLAVEREVDVRQRVCKIFNRREENFDSQREYDDYLEHIEQLIFDIANGGPEAAAADREVQEYERQNKQEIIQNSLKAKADEQYAEALARGEQEQSQRLQSLALELQQQEDELERELERETLRGLEKTRAGSAQADRVVAEASERMRTRVEELRAEYERQRQQEQAYGRQRALAAKQRRTESAQGKRPATPFTPFAGDRMQHHWKQWAYQDPLMRGANEPLLRAGGFNPAHAQEEALVVAFWGLEVDVQQEKHIAAH